MPYTCGTEKTCYDLAWGYFTVPPPQTEDVSTVLSLDDILPSQGSPREPLVVLHRPWDSPAVTLFPAFPCLYS